MKEKGVRDTVSEGVSHRKTTRDELMQIVRLERESRFELEGNNESAHNRSMHGLDDSSAFPFILHSFESKTSVLHRPVRNNFWQGRVLSADVGIGLRRQRSIR